MSKINLSENSIFSIQATNLLGNIKNDEIISSHDFMIWESKKLEELQDNPQFHQYVWEYSNILKLLVKNELLIEMHKRIENIDTFYN